MASAILVDGSGRFSTVKDPDSVLDYIFDWTDWLADIEDTIFSILFIAEGISVNSFSHDGVTATAFISGGVVDVPANLICRITTAGGRVEDCSLKFKIKER